MTSQTSKILIASILALVVVGGGLYFMRTSERIEKGDAVYNSEAPYRGNEDRLLTSAKCVELGKEWKMFASDETSLTFCVKDTWGTAKLIQTQLSSEVQTGELYYITFPEAPSVSPGPRMSYTSLDYKKSVDSDVPPRLDWTALDFSKSETDLALLFPYDGKVTVQKLVVNEKNVLKEYSDYTDFDGKRIQSVSYYLANVQINGSAYNLAVGGLSTLEKDFEAVVQSMSF